MISGTLYGWTADDVQHKLCSWKAHWDIHYWILENGDWRGLYREPTGLMTISHCMVQQLVQLCNNIHSDPSKAQELIWSMLLCQSYYDSIDTTVKFLQNIDWSQYTRLEYSWLE
jgi:hypothetical protein